MYAMFSIWNMPMSVRGDVHRPGRNDPSSGPSCELGEIKFCPVALIRRNYRGIDDGSQKSVKARPPVCHVADLIVDNFF